MLTAGFFFVLRGVVMELADLLVKIRTLKDYAREKYERSEAESDHWPFAILEVLEQLTIAVGGVVGVKNV